MMKSRSLALLCGASLLTSCVLFEEELPEPTFGPFDSGTTEMDGGEMDDGGTQLADAGDMGGQQQDSGMDMGADADVMYEPWTCPPLEIGTDGRSSADLEIGALADGKLVVGWSNGSTHRFYELNADGSEAREFTLSNGSTGGAANTFEILTDGTDSYWLIAITTSGTEIRKCTWGQCDAPTRAGFDADAVSGDWNGGEFLPYLHAVDGLSILSQAFTGNTFATTLRTDVEAATTFESFRMRLLEDPPSVGLTTPTSAVYVSANTINYYDRLTSGDAVGPIATMCSATAASTQKAVPSRTARGRIFADVVEATDVFVGEFDCDSAVATRLTTPLIGLRDWQVIESDGGDRDVVHVSSEGLQVSFFDGAVMTQLIDQDSYDRVDMVRTSNRDYAVVSLNSDGIVQLRLFGPNGECTP